MADPCLQGRPAELQKEEIPSTFYRNIMMMIVSVKVGDFRVL